jgi:hypothetical protein
VGRDHTGILSLQGPSSMISLSPMTLLLSSCRHVVMQSFWVESMVFRELQYKLIASGFGIQKNEGR